MKGFINNLEVEFEANETVLEVARRYEQYIPTLCELADIDHTPGTCRVCLVEITRTGQDKTHLMTSCNTPMEEGLSVSTRTKNVRDQQRLQAELLLADHDQDCASCIRHGNCELQDVAQFVGLQQSRFGAEKCWEGRDKDTSSPAMVRDMTKCIRCFRCVAVCRDVQDVDALVIKGTGINTQIGLRGGDSQVDSDCVTCGQCVMVCPVGALAERDDTETVIDYLYDPEVTTVFQFAPAIRVGFGEEFGMETGSNVEGKIIASLRKLGGDIILDTNFAADVVIMEEGTELIHQLKNKQRPTFTSCCPAWINFAEKNYPELLPNLSTTKSPQNVLGTLAKTYMAEKMEIDPKKMRVISIMPCTAKKDEIVRPQLQLEGDMPEVDTVLTTREFARLLRREGVDFAGIEPSRFDNPYMTEYSGAGAIFGTTGGVMEAAIRTVYFVLNGKELDGTVVEQLRGFDGVRAAKVDLGDAVGTVKVAMCHGLKGAREICDAVLAGDADFDFIEVMACPGGCVDGGGNLRSKKAYLPHALKRRDTLFQIDANCSARQSHNNEQVQNLYAEYLGEPHVGLAHDLLHTYYTDRRKEVTTKMKDIWSEIKMSTMVY